jgi:hypothetical protein
MYASFFSRTGQTAVGVALVGVLVYAVAVLSPVAVNRWW